MTSNERKPRTWADLLALSVFLLLVFVQPGGAERLPLRTYTVADGLAHNIINRIVRDSRGFLWFCTFEGLSLFDGYRFTNYGVDEGLPRPYVNDILEAQGGQYWVATNVGLYKFDPKGRPGRATSAPGARAQPAAGAMFTLVAPTPDGQPLNITTILRGRDGAIWCGTATGLWLLSYAAPSVELRAAKTEPPSPLPGTVNALVEDRGGTLWIGAANGLYRRWPDGTTERYGSSNGLPDETIHDLLHDRKGSLWVGTRAGGLARLAIEPGHAPPVVKSIYNKANGLGTDWVFDLHESSDGTLWVGTNGGLAEIAPADRGERPLSNVYTRRQGFANHEITTVTEDGNGNLWLGTVHGAMKLVRNGFVTFGEEDGLYSAISIFESGTGDVYAAGYVLGDQKSSVFEATKLDFSSLGTTYWQGIGRFDGRRFVWSMPEVMRRVTTSWGPSHIALARTGEWWIGTARGLYLFPPCRNIEELRLLRPLAAYGTGDGLATPMVYHLFEDSRGDLWISTAGETGGNGLARWTRTNRTIQNMAGTAGLPPLTDRLPVSIGEDKAGNVWVGFMPSGLARYSGGRFTFFTTDEGLPAGSIRTMYLDRAGHLWIGSSRGGVSRVDDPSQPRPTFATVSSADGLSSNLVTALTEDLEGRIYAATGRGLDRIAPGSGRIKHFTTADGLGPGEIDAALRDRRGVLWFGTTQGVLRLIPEAEDPILPPPIVINGLSVGGERQNVSPLGEADIALPELAYDRRGLQVDFVGVSFAPGETLRYQYRLEGTDPGWGPLTEQRSVNFARLAPGRYTFLVRAVNSEGVPSTTPARVTFAVLPPLWQRWWVLSLGGLALGLTWYEVYRYRAAQVRELERVRTRIARDLHDDIGAGLTRISVLSEIASREATDGVPVTERLSVVAGVSRELVDSMSDIVWVINPGRDQLRDLTQRMRRFASDVLTSRAVALSFRAPEDDQSLKIGADVRRQLFLIYKELVNNTVRHSGCRTVEIELEVVDRQFVLTVRDDGRGFDAARAYDGNGLSSMRERARRIQGRLDVNSGDGLGTTVRLTVPVDATVKEENTRLRRMS